MSEIEPKADADADAGQAPEADLARRRLAFGAWVNDYHQHRPRYPQAVVDRILNAAGAASGTAGPVEVLELGAGTGILTESLVAAGAHVIALEPDERMHEQLQRALPSTQRFVASAEEIPVPDARVDVVAGAQMWHWVDPERAIPEAARVLRPGGALVILWALRDDRVSWVADLNEAVGLTDTYRRFTDRNFPDLGPDFDPPTVTTIEYTEPTSTDRLVAQFRTHSALILRGDFEQTEARTRQLVREHPDLGFGDPTGEFEQPYVCKMFIAARRPTESTPSRLNQSGPKRDSDGVTEFRTLRSGTCASESSHANGPPTSTAAPESTSSSSSAS